MNVKMEKEDFELVLSIVAIIVGVVFIIMLGFGVTKANTQAEARRSQTQELNQSVKVYMHKDNVYNKDLELWSSDYWGVAGYDDYQCINAKVEYDEITDEYTCILIFKKILED